MSQIDPFIDLNIETLQLISDIQLDLHKIHVKRIRDLGLEERTLILTDKLTAMVEIYEEENHIP